MHGNWLTWTINTRKSHKSTTEIMKLLLILAIASSHVLLIQSSGVERPRGLPLSKVALYDPSKEFRCLDGSKVMHFDAVNDDYCDCADGSDEPGTAACPTNKFYCVNKGHKPSYMPSSRVNDGICDCCDGSDEYDGLATCPNMCAELGASSRIAAERRAKTVQEGFELRQTMAETGAKLKTEHTARVEELKMEREKLQPTKAEMDENKKDVEDRERAAKSEFADNWEKLRDLSKREQAEKVFHLLDINNDGQIDAHDLKDRLEFDDDLDDTVSEQEVKDALQGDDTVDKETFITRVWENFRLTYKSPEDVDALNVKADDVDDGQKDMDKPVPEGQAVIETQHEEEEVHAEKKQHWDARGELVDDIDDEGEEEEDDIGDEDEENTESNHKARHQESKRSKYSEEETQPDYTEDIKELIKQADEIRRLSQELDDKVAKVEEDITSAEAFTSMDFGVDSAWAALKEQCVELTDSSYVYKLCLFDKATQKPRDHGHETNLGRWGEWVKNEGEETHDHMTQLYKGGQGCWNAGDRLTKVIFECGTTNQLLSASEPGRCEYEFRVATPAACPDPATVSESHVDHEEL